MKLWVLSSVLVSCVMGTSPETAATVSLADQQIRAATFSPAERPARILWRHPLSYQNSGLLVLFEEVSSGAFGILNRAKRTSFLIPFMHPGSGPV